MDIELNHRFRHTSSYKQFSIANKYVLVIKFNSLSSALVPYIVPSRGSSTAGYCCAGPRVASAMRMMLQHCHPAYPTAMLRDSFPTHCSTARLAYSRRDAGGAKDPVFLLDCINPLFVLVGRGFGGPQGSLDVLKGVG